jgi:hypothetical protein
VGRRLVFAWFLGFAFSGGRGRKVLHSYFRRGIFRARLFAIDDQRRRTNASVLIGVGVTEPTITITAPGAGETYAAGRTIRFAGDATAGNGAFVPNSAFTWRVNLHIGDQVIRLVRPIRGVRVGSFQLPDALPSGDPNQFLRITGTVFAGGLSSSSSVDLRPGASISRMSPAP